MAKLGLAKLICSHPKHVSKTDSNCHSSRTDSLYPLTHMNTPRLVERMLTGRYLMELHMTKDEVKKEVAEKETKDSDGEALGCFFLLIAAPTHRW